MLSLTSIKW